MPRVIAWLLHYIRIGGGRALRAARALPSSFNRLRPHQWAWLHFKLALGFGWSSAILYVTPASIVQATTEGALRLWTYSTLLGAAISIVGMLSSTAVSQRTAVFGIRLELTGVILFAGGPLQYLIIQITLLAQGGDMIGQRYALAWFAYSMLAAVAVRGVILLTSLRQGVRPQDRTRDNL